MDYLIEKWHVVNNNDGTWHIAPESSFVNGERHFQDVVCDNISSESVARHIVNTHNRSLKQ